MQHKCSAIVREYETIDTPNITSPAPSLQASEKNMGMYGVADR
jgi:hypothetical protein